MSTTTSSTTCTSCGATLERVRFYPRQLITASDLNAEQQYHRERARRHNRLKHGWGVVCGLDVEPAPTKEKPWRVRVCPGFVMDPCGDEVYLAEAVTFDVATSSTTSTEPCSGMWPCPPAGAMPAPGKDTFVYLSIRYVECMSRPERIHPTGCGCDEAACEHSRIRDGYELKLLWERPKSHTDAIAADVAFAEKLAQWKERQTAGDPVPPCPACPAEPWVVLATILLPGEAGTTITVGNIHYGDRRVLLSDTARRVVLEQALTS